MRAYFGVAYVEVPSLVGKQLYEAVSLLSASSLAPRMVLEKEDAHVPAGTVLQQKPAPGTKVRANHIVSLVLAKAPGLSKMPLATGKQVDEIASPLQADGMRVRVYEIDALVPQGMCVAQWPSVGQPLEKTSTVILYRAKTTLKPVLMPDFRGQSIECVKELCESRPVAYQVFHSHTVPQGHVCTTCKVIDQRPLPGSLITPHPTKPILIQLQV